MGGREGEREREVSFACRRRLFLPLLATPLLLPPHSLILMMEENKEYISVKSLITTLAQQ